MNWPHKLLLELGTGGDIEVAGARLTAVPNAYQLIDFKVVELV